MDKAYKQLKGLLKVRFILDESTFEELLLHLYLSQPKYLDYLSNIRMKYYFEFSKKLDSIRTFLSNPKCPVKLHMSEKIDNYFYILVYEKKDSLYSNIKL